MVLVNNQPRKNLKMSTCISIHKPDYTCVIPPKNSYQHSQFLQMRNTDLCCKNGTIDSHTQYNYMSSTLIKLVLTSKSNDTIR